MSLMSPVRRCTNATYMTTMDESRGDRLSRGQILASSNCEYKLCAESNRLSLYSVSHPSTLNQWPMYDTIWSIHPQNQWQTLTLSDVGCLTWSYKNDTSMAIISQYCDPSHHPATTHDIYTVSTVPTNPHLLSSLHDHRLYIPITLCMIAILSSIIFLFALRQQRRRHQLALFVHSKNAKHCEKTDAPPDIEDTISLTLSTSSNQSKTCDNYIHPHSELCLKELKRIHIAQGNRVFVVGLATEYCNTKLLSSEAWFGKFGDIEKIVIGDNIMSILSDSRYFTVIYRKREAARKALDWVNTGIFICNDGETLRAFTGFNTYCADWITDGECNKSECHCLHGWCTHDELRASQNQERFEFKLEKTCTGQIIIRRNRSLKTV
eukprot:196182_1